MEGGGELCLGWGEKGAVWGRAIGAASREEPGDRLEGEQEEEQEDHVSAWRVVADDGIRFADEKGAEMGERFAWGTEEAGEACRLAAPEPPQPAEEDEAESEKPAPVMERHRHAPELVGETRPIKRHHVEHEQPVKEAEGKIPDRDGEQNAARAEEARPS